jgi:hypothetical protein
MMGDPSKLSVIRFIGVENHHPTHVLRKGKTAVPGFLVEVAVWTVCLQDPHGVLASIDTNSAAHLLEAETVVEWITTDLHLDVVEVQDKCCFSVRHYPFDRMQRAHKAVVTAVRQLGRTSNVSTEPDGYQLLKLAIPLTFGDHDLLVQSITSFVEREKGEPKSLAVVHTTKCLCRIIRSFITSANLGVDLVTVPFL